MPQERLQYFEEQVVVVAKEMHYPLEALGVTPAPSQANNPARLMSHRATPVEVIAPTSNQEQCLVMEM